MKRLSSALSAPLPVQRPDLDPAGTASPLASDLPDADLHALRSSALDAGQPLQLRHWLTAAADRPFSLSLQSDLAPRHLHTLLKALPEDGAVPPLRLTGPVCPVLTGSALARLLAHPGLQDLCLLELELDALQLQDLIQGLEHGAPGLTRLVWADDVDCLINDSVASILGRLPRLRQLTLQMTSNDAINQSRWDSSSLQMAHTLAALPLDSLSLSDLGCFMTALNMALPKGGSIPWQGLEVQEMDLSEAQAGYILPLTLVLVRCLADPCMRSLRLNGFHIGTALTAGDEAVPVCARQCLDLVAGLAAAVRRRSQPLDLVVDSDDLAALVLLMDGLTGDPEQTVRSDTDSDDDSAGPITCVRSLSVAYRPYTGHMEDLRSMEDMLHCVAVWLDVFPRLDTLDLLLDPYVDLLVSSADLVSRVSDHTQRQLAQALSDGPVTSLRLHGALLEPTPVFLQPCLAAATRRALHDRLRIASLDVGLDFLGQRHGLPSDLRRRLLDDVMQPPATPDPSVVLPILNRQQLSAHVARYNALAAEVHRRGGPDIPADAPLVHPLTGLSAQIRLTVNTAPGHQ